MSSSKARSGIFLRTVCAFLLLGSIACIPLRARNYEFASAPFTPRPDVQGVVRLLANNNSREKQGSPFTLAVSVRVPGELSDSVSVGAMEIRYRDESMGAEIDVLRLARASGDAMQWIAAYPGIPLEYQPIRVTGTVTVWRSNTPERVRLDVVLDPTPKSQWIFWPWSFISV
jgi:hypothetical protein